MNKNMTTLVSLFARVYHTKNSNIKIYNDIYGEMILTKEEYISIYNSMKHGIKYFNKDFVGDNPVEYIVNNNLAPSVLARSIYNEDKLQREIKLGGKQYLILASGYDASAYKVNNKIKVFELDKEKIIKDKQKRLKDNNINTNNVTFIEVDFNNNWIDKLLTSNFDKDKKTHVSLLGISYYLDKEVFKNTIKIVSNIIPSGSTIVFDYPNNDETEKEEVNKSLAKEANEEMKSTYTKKDILDISEESNTLIYEHLNYQDINNTYFYNYNIINPNNKIMAYRGVSYIMLVKK